MAPLLALVALWYSPSVYPSEAGTPLLGGYPDTTTKTLRHRGTKKNETRLSLWTTETIVRLRRREPRDLVYIPIMNPLMLLSHGMLT